MKQKENPETVVQVSSATKEQEHVVEIFKTNVGLASEANFIVRKLHQHFPSCRINFDLYDCDKILRIEGKTEDINIVSILKIVKEHNYEIELIEY